MADLILISLSLSDNSFLKSNEEFGSSIFFDFIALIAPWLKNKS